jgi:iron complex outermembrane receptor protein
MATALGLALLARANLAHANDNTHAAAASEGAVAAATTDTGANSAASGSADESGQVTEITVTARYRHESAQAVPIGITTLSSTQIADQGVSSLKQVFQQLPSLNIQGFSGRNQTITIRGIGTNAGGTTDGLEQGVGLYVDGVYRARTGSVITDLLEVQDIQLLRGPQGTLFGKNTVAGALDIKTREPSFDPEARAEVSYGNYNQLRAYGSVDAALGDKLAFRISYLRNQRDGLIYNTHYRQDWDNLDNNAVRLDVLYKPTYNFKFRFIADYSMQQGNVGFYSVAGVLPTTLANGSQVRGFYQRAADVGYVPIAIDPFARQVDIDSSQYDKMPSWGTQGRADWDVGPASLTSITAYRNWKWIPHYDGDQIGANVITDSVVATQQQQFSQELRLASNGSHKIDYTGGLYFFWQQANDQQIQVYGRDASTWLFTPNNPTAPASTIPSSALNGLVADAHVVPATYSYASYGQATWHVSPVFSLTGGLRFTYEHKTGLYDAVQGGDIPAIDSFAAAIQAAIAAKRNALAPTVDYTATNNSHNFSGTIIAAYDFTPAVHGYASYSRGYKSPGINLVTPANGIDLFVKPEKVDNYELGLKSRFFHDLAEFNLALFWTNDANYQANYINTAVTPQVSYITNVGDVRSRGVEVDARATPLTGLTLGLAGTYNDAVYLSYTNAPAQYLYTYLGSQNLSGQTASGAPKWAITSNAEYVRPIGAATEAYLGGDFSYRSSFYAAINLDPFSRVPGYTVTGLHAGLRRADNRWDLTFWVRNLFDKDYYNTKALSTQYGVVLGALGDPRMFGFTLKGRL